MKILKNYLSTMLFILIIYIFYLNNNYLYGFLNNTYSFAFSTYKLSSLDVFKYIIYFYAIFLIPFYFLEKSDGKALVILKAFYKKINYKDYSFFKEEKTALLAWLLKAFYAPLMINWLVGHIFSLVNNFYNFSLNYKLNFEESIYAFFNNNLFPTFFALILFVDVAFFTFGYLFESNFLKNKIISVEPTFFGWGVTLICYPPFNDVVSKFFGWYSSDMGQFGNNFFHLFFNTLILILMGIYSRASFALGTKASNLTNRGIIKSGPYKYIRHPAYFCKNLAWWIGGLPVIFSSIYKTDLKTLVLAIISLSVWSYIYYLRAKTEEMHLTQTGDYLDYKKQVKNMFIPF